VLVRVEGVARNRPVNHLVLTTLRKFRKLTAAFLVKIRPSISQSELIKAGTLLSVRTSGLHEKIGLNNCSDLYRDMGMVRSNSEPGHRLVLICRMLHIVLDIEPKRAHR
jgi:hypothetical protein